MGDISFGEYNNELWWFKRGTAGATLKGFRCGNITTGGHLNLIGTSNLCNFDLGHSDRRWNLRKYISSWATMMSVGTAENWVSIPRAGEIAFANDAVGVVWIDRNDAQLYRGYVENAAFHIEVV